MVIEYVYNTVDEYRHIRCGDSQMDIYIISTSAELPCDINHAAIL